VHTDEKLVVRPEQIIGDQQQRSKLERWRLSGVYSGSRLERAMDREHVKGAADKAKGTIKEAAGKLTGDKELQSEGQIDKAKGDVHNAVGNVKDAARNLTK
jgi:uncharacterized protein YjbJ (UPF0337 family)